MNQEITYVQNHFGVVTSQRVVFYRSLGWFRGGHREDIPIRHVTSVRIGTRRHLFWGIVFLCLSLPNLSNHGSIFPWLLLAGALLLLWGSPYVVVNTAGNDLGGALGFPWHAGEANAFVEALRTQLFHRPGDATATQTHPTDIPAPISVAQQAGRAIGQSIGRAHAAMVPPVPRCMNCGTKFSSTETFCRICGRMGEGGDKPASDTNYIAHDPPT